MNEAAEEAKAKGNAALKSGDHQQAVEWYSQAIALDPGCHVYYSNRAAAYANLGQWTDALGDARQTTALAPDWPKGHVRCGDCHTALGQHEEAVKAYMAALHLDPANTGAQAGLKGAVTKVKASPADDAFQRNVSRFAQCKQRADQLMQQQQYGAAQEQYSAALQVMEELLRELTEDQSRELRSQLERLRQEMVDQLDLLRLTQEATA
eukprot:GGOE01061294.1.p2 GENE.GGOE01061294.1~~GGOE01061294.1.p2  ORF type:complete len:226 (+),score=76.13 GGOE01061294.1:55-678(+)